MDQTMIDLLKWAFEHGYSPGVYAVAAYLVVREIRRAAKEWHQALAQCEPKVRVAIEGPVPVYLVQAPEKRGEPKQAEA